MSPRVAAACAGLLLSWAAAVWAQASFGALDLDHPAIAYRSRPSNDAVAQLNRRLLAGEVVLQWRENHGYLRSVLDALAVPIESQVVVYSKTSLQSAAIDSRNPRAVYFNDSVAIAWVPGGFIEVAAVDAQLGPVFYLLPAQAQAVPQLVRDPRCLSCHLTSSAGGVPAIFVRSIPTAADGATLPWLGNATTDHTTPVSERWGGWYVTGSAGTQQHLGNLRLRDRTVQELPSWDRSRVVDRLPVDASDRGYPSAHSDIAALLVFEHQTRATNLITRTGWLARMAAHEGQDVVDSPAVRDAVAELTDYLLFTGETPLDGVRGSSGFTERFAAAGPRDGKGRSLRDLDLGTRLMRYPCSFMIYSEAFDALPDAVRREVFRRMKSILSGESRDAKYAHLMAADRQAILEILRETKPDLPPGF